MYVYNWFRFMRFSSYTSITASERTSRFLLTGSKILHFTTIGSPLAARGIRILPMNQNSRRPITFGLKRNASLVDLLTAICFTSTNEVGGSYQPHYPFVLSYS
jgi:hypothetical protein